MTENDKPPGARSLRSGLRHWGTELAVVAVGVLLALWAQLWLEGRTESGIHRETVAQMDELLGRALVQQVIGRQDWPPGLQAGSSCCARSS